MQRSHWLLGAANRDEAFSFIPWAIFLFKHMVLFSLISYSIAFLLDKGMKDFSQRVLYIIKEKLIKKNE